VNALSITPDKRFLAAAGNPHVRLYELNTPNPNPVRAKEMSMRMVSFQNKGHELRGAHGQCHGHRLPEGGAVDVLWQRGQHDQDLGPQVVPLIYQYSSIGVCVCRSPTYTRDYDNKAQITCVAVHPNQVELISGDQNGSIKIWDLQANLCAHELVPDEGVAIRSLSVAADGSMLVAGNNKGDVYVWRMDNSRDATSFRPLSVINAHKKNVLKCLLSPDIRLLATTSADHTVKIWNTQKFTLEKTLTGHQRWVWDCAFSADSAYLVTGTVARLFHL